MVTRGAGSEQRVEYIERMRASYWFRTLGIEPIWVPGTGDVDGFIHDEVVRQSHDPRIEADGGVRVRWMREAWDFALEYEGEPLTVALVEQLGRLVEPEDNAYGFRRGGESVWIGGRRAPDGQHVRWLVGELLGVAGQVRPEQGVSEGFPFRDGRYSLTVGEFAEQTRSIRTADDFYLAYEWVHPFTDGNGRTGKILHNLLMGRLHDPVLIADWFGGGNP